MDNTVIFAVKRDIENKLKVGSFSHEIEKNNLINQGFSEEYAQEIILETTNEFKANLFYKIKEDKELEERGKIATAIAITIPLLFSFLGTYSTFTLLITVAIAALCGFYGFPKKPMAAIIGFAVGAILMPFVTKFYFQGRTSFIKFELIVPMAAAFGPGLLIKYLIAKFMYEDNIEE